MVVPACDAWVVVQGRMSVPCREISYAARALTIGSFRLPQVLARTREETLICHSPIECSPVSLSAPVSPPDSASAIAVQVVAWSGVNPAARAAS